jgi:hypothetical protein
VISADPDDLGPALDPEQLDWGGGTGERRIAPPGEPPAVTVTPGQPLGWWGPDRPGGAPGDCWLIVRFAASFRADRGSKVEWSRLSVDLPGAAGAPLIAVGQYPGDVVDSEVRDIHVSVSPTLKLLEVEASVGEVSTTIRLARVIPVISPWGGQESSFGWDLTSTDRHPISGVRHFYAVIPCPEPALAVSLGLDADAVSPGGFLGRGQRSKLSQQRQVPVLLRPWD